MLTRERLEKTNRLIKLNVSDAPSNTSIDSKVVEKMLPPLYVYADIECLVEPLENGKKLFVADLICYSTTEDPPNKSHPLSGENCIHQYIDERFELRWYHTLVYRTVK